jgi:hypothetical protein
MHIRFGVELAFQDAAGAFWLRQGNGVLKRIEQHPLALYGIPRPAPWEDSLGGGELLIPAYWIHSASGRLSPDHPSRGYQVAPPPAHSSDP